MRSGTLHGRRRLWRSLMAASLCCAGAALLPATASAADPSPGCQKTGGGDPATEVTEWTCFTSPATVSGYEVQRGGVGAPRPPVNGHITRMEVDVADGAGPVPIDRLMLHHIVFFNSGRNDPMCGGAERFYGAGEERLKLQLPQGYGYPIQGGDSWSAVYMYMNHRAQTDKAWIKYSLTVDPSPGIRSVRSYWLDVGNCAFDPIYNVPGIDRPQIPTCAKLKKAAKKKGTKRAHRKAGRCRKKAKRARASIPSDASHTLSKDVTAEHSGWLVAGAGHVHGGAKELNLTKPGCGNVEVAQSTPTWGNADHPFYNVKPILHEPGPIGMSGFVTPTGIPVQEGQTLRLNSVYDNLLPHARVMGIYVVYLAPLRGGDPPLDPCGGAPGDMAYGPGTSEPGRKDPVPFTVPLTGLDESLNAIEIDGPPGPFRTLADGATIDVGDRYFSEPNVRIQQGSTLQYRFIGNELHNLTIANGPLGIGSPDARGGEVYSQRFDRPGTYRFFCGLHPVQMTERVVVEPPQKKQKKKLKRAKRKSKRA